MNNSIKLGVNTFGLGSVLQEMAEDELSRTFLNIGIQCVEPCVFFMDSPIQVDNNAAAAASGAWQGIWLSQNAAEKIKKIRQYGLEIHGAHAMNIQNQRSADSAIRFANENKLTYLVLSIETDSVEKMAEKLPLLRYMTAESAKFGVQLLYHNHVDDLKPTAQGCVLDYLLESIPELNIQLDLGWVQFAKEDCLQIMEKYSPKIKSLHFKDIWPDAQPTERSMCFTPVGEGCIPLPEIMHAAQKLGLPPYGYVIDQDASTNCMLDDLRTGAAHILQESRLADSAGIYKGEIPLSLMTFPLWRETVHHGMSFDELCRMTSEHGIKAIDLMEIELKMYDQETVKAVLAQYQMTVNCLISSVKVFTDDEKTVQQTPLKSIRTAEDLGAPLLMLVPMASRDAEIADGLTRDEILKKCIPPLQFAVSAAKQHGIQICVEDTPPCRIPLSSAAECKALLDAVPGLGLVFDTANMLAQGEDPMVFYEQMKPYICHVHLKDAVKTARKSDDCCKDGTYLSCCAWGKGTIPIQAIYERLKQDHYTGRCAIEYVSSKEHGRIANHIQLRNFIRALGEAKE